MHLFDSFIIHLFSNLFSQSFIHSLIRKHILLYFLKIKCFVK